jgi:hypothetical protein
LGISGVAPSGALLLPSLLRRAGAYPAILAAVAAGRLPGFPVTLFAHVGDVYGRVETAAGGDFPAIEAMRLAALIHEELPTTLSELLDSAGMADLAPTVLAVICQFGRVWKIGSDAEYRAYIEDNWLYLAEILLFEVAHEGRSIPAMERVAGMAGLNVALRGWNARLREPWNE